MAVTGVAKALPTENVPNLVERLFKCDGCKSKQYCCKACQVRLPLELGDVIAVHLLLLLLLRGGVVSSRVMMIES